MFIIMPNRCFEDAGSNSFPGLASAVADLLPYVSLIYEDLGRMKSRSGSWVILYGLLLAFLSSPAATQADRHVVVEIPQTAERHALVVGNAAYERDPLKNPVNDARAVAKVLRELRAHPLHERYADVPQRCRFTAVTMTTIAPRTNRASA